MRNAIPVITLSFLTVACVNMRYPNWEQVKIETSVNGKPCETRGVMAQCTEEASLCPDWFKQQATMVDANTTVMDNIGKRVIGRYYRCDPGYPPYQALSFSKKDYSQGSNIVTGQAFLKQAGGAAVTCAGNKVYLYPSTAYFLAKHEGTQEVQLSLDAEAFDLSTECDASGNFEFDYIPDGKWRIDTAINWQKSEVKTSEMPQMVRQVENLKLDVDVVSGQKNHFQLTK